MKINGIEKLNCEKCLLEKACREPGKPWKSLCLCSDARIQDLSVEAYKTGFETYLGSEKSEPVNEERMNKVRKSYLEHVVKDHQKKEGMICCTGV